MPQSRNSFLLLKLTKLIFRLVFKNSLIFFHSQYIIKIIKILMLLILALIQNMTIHHKILIKTVKQSNN